MRQSRPPHIGWTWAIGELYEEALVWELSRRGLLAERQPVIPISIEVTSLQHRCD